MTHFLLVHEGFIRLVFFFGLFFLMAIWEILAPRRKLKTSKRVRWYSNLGLVFIDTLALRLLLPIQAMGTALFIEKKGWGILNNLPLPFWMAIVIGIFGLDLVIYLQHAMFHTLPAFWRLHRVHHTDLDFDTTTGVRFHPIEILLSMGIKMATVVFLGINAIAVVIFEIVLNGTSLFNHGNVHLPAGIDRVLRLFVVTPEMHRVHHSILIREYNSNFGFNFPWWDRLLGTYRPQPEAGHEAMTIGLSLFRDAASLTLPWLLVLPFVPKSGKSSKP
jgi:sterol desaturase/sphingolipid hydroxylase (fatty acid hydroxylase superfamily)